MIVELLVGQLVEGPVAVRDALKREELTRSERVTRTSVDIARREPPRRPARRGIRAHEAAIESDDADELVLRRHLRPCRHADQSGEYEEPLHGVFSTNMIDHRFCNPLSVAGNFMKSR